MSAQDSTQESIAISYSVNIVLLKPDYIFEKSLSHHRNNPTISTHSRSTNSKWSDTTPKRGLKPSLTLEQFPDCPPVGTFIPLYPGKWARVTYLSICHAVAAYEPYQDCLFIPGAASNK